MNGGRSAAWTGGLILAALAAVCTALVAVTHSATAARIAANEQAYLERSQEPALGDLQYDGAAADSALVLLAPHGLPGNQPVTIYRVYLQGAPAAALFDVTARDGYAGPVRLLIGVDAEGVVTGVRALSHRETPGLGDLIDVDKSDWILQFTHRSLLDPPAPGWAIERDGGVFDQLTGASITPRAVTRAIRQTLIYFSENRQAVFAAPEPE